MKQILLHSTRDFFIGVFALTISLTTYTTLANDSLIIYFIMLSFTAFIGGFLLGKLSPFNKRSLIVLNFPFVLMALDEFFKSQQLAVLIPLIVLVSISTIGFYLASSWKSFTPVKAYSFALAPLSLASISFVLMMPYLSSTIYTAHTNEAVPEFQLPLINGKTFNSGSLKGKITILSFGVLFESDNSSASQSRKVLTKLSEVQNTFKSDTLITFYAINVGSKEDANRFSENNPYNFIYGYDTEGIRHYFRTYTQPALIILDKSGKVRYKSYGYFEERELENILTEEIERLLNE